MMWTQTQDGPLCETKTIIITFLVTRPYMQSAHKLLELHIMQSPGVRGGGGEGQRKVPRKVSTVCL